MGDSLVGEFLARLKRRLHFFNVPQNDRFRKEFGTRPVTKVIESRVREIRCTFIESLVRLPGQTSVIISDFGKKSSKRYAAIVGFRLPANSHQDVRYVGVTEIAKERARLPQVFVFSNEPLNTPENVPSDSELNDFFVNLVKPSSPFRTARVQYSNPFKQSTKYLMWRELGAPVT